VTGDGRADLVVYRPDGTGGTEMLVLAATGTGTAVTVSPPASWGVIPAPSMPNREIVRTGDVNGDGKADLVRVADEGGQTVVWVHTSTGNAFDIGTRWYESGSGTFDFDRLRVVVADVAGSPAADVAVVHGHEPGVTGITALVSDGSRLTAGPVWNAPAGALDTGGLWVTGADVAGDDHVDLITVVDSLDGHTAASAHIATDSTFTAPTAVWDSGQREWTTLSVGGLGPVPNLTSAAELSSSSNAPPAAHQPGGALPPPRCRSRR